MKLLFTLAVGCLLISCSSVTKIYLVRHAEKASNSANPDLKSPEGIARANALKDSLATVTLSSIFSTNYLRTIHTAAPVAAAQNLRVITYTDGNTLADSLSQTKNKKYLVVGHSNTIPGMIRHLGLDPGFTGDIADNEFDDLFIVTIKRKGSSLQKSVVRKAYGAPSP